MYDQAFEAMVRKWKGFEITTTNLNKFVEWFRTYKSKIVKRSMLRPVREQAGLGKPPAPFTTNASESMNAVLKRKVDYKRSELSTFLHEVKELIKEQDSEIEKAVIDRGKYKISPEFKKFSKTEEEWFTKMKEGDRVRHLQRFASFKLPGSTHIQSTHRSIPGFTHGSGHHSSKPSGHGSTRASGSCSSEHSTTHSSGNSLGHYSTHSSAHDNRSLCVRGYSEEPSCSYAILSNPHGALSGSYSDESLYSRQLPDGDSSSDEDLQPLTK